MAFRLWLYILQRRMLSAIGMQCLLLVSLMSTVVYAEVPVTVDEIKIDNLSGSEVGVMERTTTGQNTEQQLSPDLKFTPWVQEGDFDKKPEEVQFETKKVLEKKFTTKKLKNVVPAIRFKSGAADIPQEYIEKLRNVLNEMRDRINVRLHFVGHSDNVKLSGDLLRKYGSNLELSKERAGSTAEHFQRTLDLPPEAISYDGFGDSQPVASNKTESGRASNRRVEVQVWYDEVAERVVDRQVAVDHETQRIKVCRVETVCKIRYKTGHSRRARLRNLVPPLQYVNGDKDIPAQYIQQLKQVLKNLDNKQNVQIKIIGHTDTNPLIGRDFRIYGNHRGISSARARRTAQEIQEKLGLPNKAVASKGKGSSQPIASNNSEQGRALNRRFEVEFWHDDPLEELSGEPQICPEASAAETAERIYNPPEGDIKPIYFEKGKPVIPQGYSRPLIRAMDDIKDKGNVRLRFIGYTSNERLDRRTAMVYGDDIGLSTARARRTMLEIQKLLTLTDKQVEAEGHGYVQSKDVVNLGFVELDRSKIEVQIVYDELAVLDDTEGLEIKRLSRDVTTKNPYALNLMRISVDGQPVNDPDKNSPDVQRCVDVALDKAEIKFRFDNLDVKPRLNITAWPNIISHQDLKESSFVEDKVNFKLYSNYPAFIEKAEVRLFKAKQSTRDTPVQVVPVGRDGLASWRFNLDDYSAPRLEMKYVLRVYDKTGNFDETKRQTFWVVDELETDNSEKDFREALLVGYGENRLGLNNIAINGGVVKVTGNNIPPKHNVWFAGYSVPVSENRNFTSELILPNGLHTVELSVTDQSGNGNVYMRDLELKRNDWFYVGMADITISQDKTNGPAKLVTGDQTHYDNDLSVDGRLAFYTKGKFSNDWQLTASADTREGPIGDLFSNFMNKSPDILFRRIDPDYFYPAYGDDSVVEEDAPTSGKFFLKLQKENNHAMWGNFDIDYTGNNLAHVDRSLYGANINYQSESHTSFGENRVKVNLFAAEPGTLAAREEFRSTSGSLYFFKHQDITQGSDRLRIEVRDRITGLVLGVKNLVTGLDYDIDYLQGRIMLNEPVSAFAPDDTIIDTGGNQVFLVARYEYTPGFDELDDIAIGGQVHYWYEDFLRFGFTANTQEVNNTSSELGAVDLTIRKNTFTWLKLEQSASQGPVSSSLLSSDGGYEFAESALAPGTDLKAGGSRIDGSLRISDIYPPLSGQLTYFQQELVAGYSAPGLISNTDTKQKGLTLKIPFYEVFNVNIKGDSKTQKDALNVAAVEVDVNYQFDQHWSFSTGVRREKRRDDSPVIPSTQKQGNRSDIALRTDYNSLRDWAAYSFIQDTSNSSGNRETNARFGIGTNYRTSDRFKLNGEVSDGDTGTALKLGTDYKMSDNTDVYSQYVLENERADNGIRARRGNLASGFQTRYTDSASIYMEEKYIHGDVPTGLTSSLGVDLAVNDRLNFGANIDAGTLTDNNTAAEISRTALGFTFGYKFSALTWAGALEYRKDKTQQSDTTVTERTTWLTKNSLKFSLNPDWRLLGKVNWSESKSSLGEFYDGDFIEAVLGYAYRPTAHNNFNALMKYTYFYNVPATDQVTLENTAVEYIQKSQILSIDATYDLTARWSLGGKLAYRYGQLSRERVNPQFFASDAALYIIRADWHLTHRWDLLLEGRMLEVVQAEDKRSGILLGFYRHFSENIKMGIGYNFTDFSDDLTDLDFDSQGLFINVIGKF